MKGKVVNFLLLYASLLILGACQSQQSTAPEPHLELGQRLNFVGGEADKTYVIVGYRHMMEDKTDKDWSNQAYIVVSYTNNQGDMKEGVVHRNAIQKR